jgi:Fic family protein
VGSGCKALRVRDSGNLVLPGGSHMICKTTSDTLARIDANKAAIDKARPFEGETLNQLRDYYRIGLTWSSNALEGNSLTETETKVLIEDGLTVGGKPLRDTFEALGHAAAYDYMFSLINEKNISIEDIKRLHYLFYKAIDEPNAGVWRTKNVIVTGTDFKFPAHSQVDRQIHDLEQWMNASRNTMHPIKFAALLHLRFVTIHPFVDGNGRVARLLMNASLIQDGYLPAIVPPILRTEYLATIRTYQLRGDENPFCDLVADRVLESKKEIMRLLDIES